MYNIHKHADLQPWWHDPQKKTKKKHRNGINWENAAKQFICALNTTGCQCWTFCSAYTGGL